VDEVARTIVDAAGEVRVDGDLDAATAVAAHRAARLSPGVFDVRFVPRVERDALRASLDADVDADTRDLLDEEGDWTRGGALAVVTMFVPQGGGAGTYRFACVSAPSGLPRTGACPFEVRADVTTRMAAALLGSPSDASASPPTLTSVSLAAAPLLNEIGRASPDSPMGEDALRSFAATWQPPSGFTATFVAADASRPARIEIKDLTAAVCLQASSESTPVGFEGESWESPYALVQRCPAAPFR